MLCDITKRIKKNLFMTSAGWAAKHQFNAWYVRRVISKLDCEPRYAGLATGIAGKIVKKLRQDEVLT